VFPQIPPCPFASYRRDTGVPIDSGSARHTPQVLVARHRSAKPSVPVRSFGIAPSSNRQRAAKGIQGDPILPNDALSHHRRRIRDLIHSIPFLAVCAQVSTLGAR